MIPIHSIQGDDGIGKSILDGLNPIHSIQGDGIGKSVLDCAVGRRDRSVEG